jgi:polyisoprenoid-binding protein YceI
VASPPCSTVEHFTIDTETSWLTAHVGTTGLLSFLGHEHTIAIREFAGEASLTAEVIEPASIRMTFQASSLSEVDPHFSEEDRVRIDQAVRDEAVEASRFGTIVFESTEIASQKVGEGEYLLRISGTLLMHGVKKAITVPAELTLRGESLTARGEITLTHGEFGMERLSVAGGAVKASDQIVVAFQFRARRSP